MRTQLLKSSHRAGFVAVGILVLLGVIAIPFLLLDLGNELMRKAEGTMYSIGTPNDATAAFLDVQIIALNDTEQTATVRVSALTTCDHDCTYKNKIILTSLSYENEPDEFPDTTALTLTPNVSTTETLKLPYTSQLYRYPFDRADLILGISMQRIAADMSVTRIPADTTRNELFAAVHNSIPRTVLERPGVLDPAKVRPTRTRDIDYAFANSLVLVRPLYVQLIVVFVMLFITVLAAYVVFLRPFDQLITVTAGLVLATWGIRALVLGNVPTDITFVDIYLMGVVFFALFVTVIRGLNYLHQAGEWRIPGFTVKKAEEPKPEAATPITVAPPPAPAVSLPPSQPQPQPQPQSPGDGVPPPQPQRPATAWGPYPPDAPGAERPPGMHPHAGAGQPPGPPRRP